MLPVLRRNLDTGGPISHTTAIVAGWARYAEGVDEAGQPIEIVDRLADQVTAMARHYDQDPLALLSIEQLFGDLSSNEQFRTEYVAILRRLHEVGAARTLVELNEGALGSDSWRCGCLRCPPRCCRCCSSRPTTWATEHLRLRPVIARRPGG